MSGEWILAGEASCRDRPLEPSKCGTSLIEFASLGLLTTRAALFIDGTATPLKDVELPGSFWLAMKLKTGSAYRDWRAGAFRTAVANPVTNFVSPEAQVALGVQFLASDLDIHFPASRSPWFKPAPPVQKAVSQSKAGRKRSEEWYAWVAYLALIANDIVTSNGAEALMNQIKDRMAEDGLDEVPRSTVQPAALAVIDLLKSKNL